MAVPPEKSGFPLGWFKNKPLVREMHECSVCLEILKDAVQVKDCGHQFCRICLNDVLRSDSRCPTCRKEISEELVFTDNAANRVIGNRSVNCPSSGCEWEGTLNDLLQEHNEICCFLPLDCSFCSQNNIPRCEMDEHLGVNCKKVVIECSYSEFGCTYECERGLLEEHLSHEIKHHLKLATMEISQLKDQHEKDKKLMQEVTAKHEKDVQELTAKHEKDMQEITAKHEKDVQELTAKHEKDMLDRTAELEEEMQEIRDEHEQEMQEIRAKVRQTSPYLMIITDFNRKLSEAKESNTPVVINGEPFYTSLIGYKVKMTVSLNDTRERYKGHMGVYLRIMRSDHDAILSWPFKRKGTFILIDQQDNEEERKNIGRKLVPGGQDEYNRPTYEENVGTGFPSFVSHDVLNTRKYIKDDTVFITLLVE